MNMSMLLIRSILAGACVLASACARPANAPADEGAPGTAVQVAQGKALYGQRCAKCHGLQGKGTEKGPALIGQGALPYDPPPGAKARTTPFRTAKDVIAFVKERMPFDAPGTLTDEEAAAIVAFDASANGVDLKGQEITPATAESVVLH